MELKQKLFDRQHLEPNGSGGDRDGYGLVPLRSQQAGAYGALVGNPIFDGVCFIGAHNRVFIGFVFIEILDLDDGSDGDPLGGNFVISDDGGRADGGLEAVNFFLYLGLFLFRLVVFRVFTEVAETAGDRDLFADFIAADRHEIIQLLLQLFQSALCENSSFFFSHFCSGSFHIQETPCGRRP